MATATQTKQSFGLMTFSSAEAVESGGLKVRALTFVEGTHTDALGTKRTYSQSAIEKYANNSNAWLESGEEIPIFDSSHDLEPGGYSNKNKVGLVSGRFSSQLITAEMLPKPQFKDLIGKLGLYTDLELTRPDAIANYRRKLIKPISVGLGSFGKGPQVFEISVVPFGAVRGAMLFSHPMGEVIDVNAQEVEEEGEDSGVPEKPEKKPERKIFALTLDGAIAERSSDTDNYQIERLTDTFQRVVGSIKSTTDAELLGRDRDALLGQAITDLSDRLRKELNVPALTPVSILSREMNAAESDQPPQAESSTMTVEKDEKAAEAQAEGQVETPDFSARFSALEGRLSATESRAEAAETELARYKRNQQIGDRYLRLKQEAAALNTAGKFSRAAFLAYFPEGEQLSDAVAKFSRVAQAENEQDEKGDAQAEEIATLDEIEAALKYAKQFGQPINTGSVSGDDPLPSHPMSSVAQAEEEADMARFTARRSSK